MRRLLVAVPEDGWEADPGTGAGRVWHEVRRRLAERVRLEPRAEHRRRWRGRVRPRPDVWLSPSGTVPVQGAGAPVVAAIHGAAWLRDPMAVDLTPGWARPWVDGLIAATRRTLASADRLVVPSEFTRRDLVEGAGIPPDHVVCVPHGVDARLFSPERSGGGERVAAALGADRPYVLFASIPTIPHKNLPALRAAMELLAADGLPHALVIAGGPAGVEPADVVASVGAPLAGASDRVLWVGHVSDDRLAALMAGADAFCLPALVEAFGLTALEAMACGVPVVVADRGALPEVVGTGGWAVDPSPESLHDALRRLLQDPATATRLGETARARAETMSWDRTADGWLAVLRGAANRS